jgi:hypothetical protein
VQCRIPDPGTTVSNVYAGVHGMLALLYTASNSAIIQPELGSNLHGSIAVYEQYVMLSIVYQCRCLTCNADGLNSSRLNGG